MPTDVIMPALGVAQETGKVLRWLRREGDIVRQGEPLLEIETDKATVELEAPASGLLSAISAAEGETVPVGRTIAHILGPGETQAAPPVAPSPPPPASAPATSARVAASPKARRLARERGIALAGVVGSGPGGAVLASDVARLSTHAAVPRQAGASVPEASVPALGTIWRLMAERTTSSWTTAPHFFLLREVDATRLIAWRETYQKRVGTEVTYTDLLVRLVSTALGAHPHLNARWDAGHIVFHEAIHIGVAVATEAGLVVPVIHDAGRLSVAEIARRRAELVERARAGRLRPDDIQGGTFTISNLGMYGVDAFVAIINPPQAAILAVGRIAGRVVPVDGQPAVRPMMLLCLSCDHRVVDGVRGAQFLAALVDLIEEPASLVE
ncbi:MAG: dihydrolipoamide acetyltransferase family protein [Armatimonadota bacterium]|nr:dihydrolipoamide acetyltransferase family protein [Armatimonadota bacterium]MDR7520543.1 dihydrolipoamide acetyltransferase family protein [Armatimonadota bacterium]MDR7550641.1 dihydrolipoamide acetyltransferase family protein [Armatimonadota bacterium]